MTFSSMILPKGEKPFLRLKLKQKKKKKNEKFGDRVTDNILSVFGDFHKSENHVK